MTITNVSHHEDEGATLVFSITGIGAAGGFNWEFNALYNGSEMTSYYDEAQKATITFEGEWDRLTGEEGRVGHLGPLGFGTDSISLTRTVIPLPGAVWLLGTGLICLVGVRKKNKG